MDLMDLDGASSLEKILDSVKGIDGSEVKSVFRFEYLNRAELTIFVSSADRKKPSILRLDKTKLDALRKNLDLASKLFDEANEIIIARSKALADKKAEQAIAKDEVRKEIDRLLGSQ